MELTSYDLSRKWFDWCFENPELISPNHSAIYFFAIEHCNRLGWKEKFGFPTQMAMDAIGIKKHSTYIKYFEDLCEWGFFKLVQKSKNQYSSNIISLVSALPKNGKALDKAIIKHTAKQNASNGQSNSSILKQETSNKENFKIDTVFSFDEFWDLYDKKVGKTTSKALFDKTTEAERKLIKEYIPKYKKNKPEVKYRKDPERFLKYKVWEDEIISDEIEDNKDKFFANGEWHKKTPMQKYH